MDRDGLTERIKAAFKHARYTYGSGPKAGHFDRNKIAAELDITVQAVAKILRGGQGLALDRAARLAIKAGVDLYWLALGDRPMTPKPPEPVRVDALLKRFEQSAEAQALATALDSIEHEPSRLIAFELASQDIENIKQGKPRPSAPVAAPKPAPADRPSKPA